MSRRRVTYHMGMMPPAVDTTFVRNGKPVADPAIDSCFGAGTLPKMVVKEREDGVTEIVPFGATDNPTPIVVRAA